MKIEFGEEKEEAVPIQRMDSRNSFRIRSWERERRERRGKRWRDFWSRLVKKIFCE